MKRGVRRAPVALLLTAAGLVACGGGESASPTSPSTSSSIPSQTRAIELEGDLNFGDVAVGSFSEKVVRIVNRGSAALTVRGMTLPNGGAFIANWITGAIAANQWQDITVRFSPPAEQSYTGTWTVNADHTSGVNTMSITARGVVRGPRTQFTSGTHLVNTDIAAGRYFSDPTSGCYWERLSGLGGSLSEIISSEFIGYNAGQWIVDVAGSDRAFKTDPSCGTWFRSARPAPPANTITPGMWLVNQQLSAGTYRTTASSGCYWARLRNFGGRLDGIIANDFVSEGGSVTVSITFGDAGFEADPSCGPSWTRVSSLAPTTPSRQDVAIEQNWKRARSQYGVR